MNLIKVLSLVICTIIIYFMYNYENEKSVNPKIINFHTKNKYKEYV